MVFVGLIVDTPGSAEWDSHLPLVLGANGRDRAVRYACFYRRLGSDRERDYIYTRRKFATHERAIRVRERLLPENVDRSAHILDLPPKPDDD